ncbi:MAG: alpha/beta fold hydrolase [Marinifilaceae bacterium]|jgi:homoserine O-acetyltransferase|nr:alpha/beta fold hydrolase [Marinifilaceae bacterium]
MKTVRKLIALLSIVLIAVQANAQAQLKIANIGNFKTTHWQIIKNCKIGYRTFGKLNKDKSNVVVIPTWFTATSDHLFDFGVLRNNFDTDNHYFIIIDALGNGISASPSNTDSFPEISIRDMVNTQYKLLTEKLGIKKVKAIAGISMGGMQAYEWLLAYPDFMDKVISIIATPKQSAYDLMLWDTQIKLIEKAGENPKDLRFAMERATDIFTLNLFTPAYIAKNINEENQLSFIKAKYDKMMKPKNYLAQLKAIRNHDIYNSNFSSEANVIDDFKAEVLIIVNKQDHIVNPLNSIQFAKNTNSKLVVLDFEHGHTLPFYKYEEIKKATSDFLKK